MVPLELLCAPAGVRSRPYGSHQYFQEFGSCLTSAGPSPSEEVGRVRRGGGFGQRCREGMVLMPLAEASVWLSSANGVELHAPHPQKMGRAWGCAFGLRNMQPLPSQGLPSSALEGAPALGTQA